MGIGLKIYISKNLEYQYTGKIFKSIHEAFHLSYGGFILMRIKIIPNNQLKALVALSNNSTFIQPQNNKQKIALYCLRYYCILTRVWQ